MIKAKSGAIYVGIGGWTYEPWRGVFYPEGMAQKRELRFASEKLTSIEINGTYYRTQSPESFAKWRDETPEGFVFSVKGPRFCVNRRVLGDGADSVKRFFASGVMELKNKLGPILWQFLPNKKFDLEDFRTFLKMLPSELQGRELRHAIEVRNDSFRSPDFIELAREQNVAIVVAGDSKYPLIADVTAPFVYARLQGTQETESSGYHARALDAWAARARVWAEGGAPADFPLLTPSEARQTPRDVYLYVISGFKERNPLAAGELIKRLD